ncbi:hypothetical protein GEMRC1_002062 [Eukaryota sp. GEM-RC1]
MTSHLTETQLRIGSEYLSIIPLGAGQEVGRSCIIVKFHGKSIMLDCGIHPAETGEGQLPFFDEIDPSTIDVVLISHFHLDHIGAVPYFCTKTSYTGPVYMTHPTRAVFRMLMSDFLRQATEAPIFNESNLEDSLKRITAVQYHQVCEFAGLRFWCYNAGHVLGACMWMIEFAGTRVLYTGDFSRHEDRHLCAAETPNIRPDVVICESTYGISTHRPREEREQQLTDNVGRTIRRGGKVLMPVFALGRAQELLLVLDEYWDLNPDLQQFNLFYASSLAQRCMPLFRSSINSMNEQIQEQFNIRNPFIFKHVKQLKETVAFDQTRPCVVMASPGMLQSGLSRELFDLWCTDDKNMVLLPGYSVAGTLAKTLQSDPLQVTLSDGRRVGRKIEIVSNISFSAHSDSVQTKEFISETNPRHVVLVHGESNEMIRFQNDLKKQFGKLGMGIHAPKNISGVKLRFKQDRVALVRGSLAETASKGGRIDGVLVQDGLDLSIVAPEDIGAETGVEPVSVISTVRLPRPNGDVGEILGALPLDVEKLDDGKWRVANVEVVDEGDDGEIVLDWESSLVDDLVVDAISIALLKGQDIVDYSNAFCKECSK